MRRNGLLIVASVLVLAVIAYVMGVLPRAVAPAGGDESPVGQGEGAVLPSAMGATRPLEGSAEASVGRVPAPSPHGNLTIVATYGGSRPAVDIGIGVRRWGEDPGATTWGRTDSGGRLRLGALQVGEVFVQVDRADLSNQASATILAGETTIKEITLPLPSVVLGEVVDERGQYVAGAEVLVAPAATVGFEARCLAVTDAAGRFTVSTCHVPCLVAARARGYGTSPLQSITVRPGDTKEGIVRLVLPVGGQVAGLVTDAAGRPIPGALVRVGRGSLDGLTLEQGVADSLPCQVVADADGRFQAVGLQLGLQPVVARAVGHAPWKGEHLVTATPGDDLNLVLEAGGGLCGTVRDERGNPISRAIVRVGQKHELEHRQQMTDAQGRFSLQDLIPGDRELTAEHRKFGTVRVSVLVTKGKLQTTDLVLSKGRVLSVTVLDDSQEVLAGATVQARVGGIAARTAFTDARGHVEFTNLDRGPIALVVGHSRCYTQKVEGVDDSQPVTVVCKLLPAATCSVVGVVVAEDRGLQNALVKLDPVDPRVDAFSTMTGVDGYFRGDVTPGAYDFYVMADGFPISPRQSVELSAGKELDLGTIVLTAGGRVSLDLPADGPPGVLAILRDAAGEIASTIYTEKGRAGTSQLVSPGTYDVRASGPSIGTQWLRGVQVRAGAVARLRIEARRCVEQVVQVTGDAAAWNGKIVRTRVLSGDECLTETAFTLAVGREDSSTFWLEGGSYEFEVTCEGASHKQTVTVPSSGVPPAVQVRL